MELGKHLVKIAQMKAEIKILNTTFVFLILYNTSTDVKTWSSIFPNLKAELESYDTGSAFEPWKAVVAECLKDLASMQDRIFKCMQSIDQEVTGINEVIQKTQNLLDLLRPIQTAISKAKQICEKGITTPAKGAKKCFLEMQGVCIILFVFGWPCMRIAGLFS